MISIIPEGFNDFHCKAGSCRHTCCQTWEIDIDEDTADLYRSQPGPLGDDLRASLETGEDGVTHIRLNEKGFCPSWIRMARAGHRASWETNASATFVPSIPAYGTGRLCAVRHRSVLRKKL